MRLMKHREHENMENATRPLPMSRKMKKGFLLYAVVVVSICMNTANVYASDPLNVVNNLSTFTDPGNRSDPARFWNCPGRSFFKKP